MCVAKQTNKQIIKYEYIFREMATCAKKAPKKKLHTGMNSGHHFVGEEPRSSGKFTEKFPVCFFRNTFFFLPVLRPVH